MKGESVKFAEGIYWFVEGVSVRQRGRVTERAIWREKEGEREIERKQKGKIGSKLG